MWHGERHPPSCSCVNLEKDAEVKPHIDARTHLSV
jgi:hypothetical protein